MFPKTSLKNELRKKKDFSKIKSDSSFYYQIFPTFKNLTKICKILDVEL